MRGVMGPAAAIEPAAHQTPYPNKGQKFNDEAVSGDSGGNFGRVARGGVMQTFIDEMMLQPVAGIPLTAWQRFLKIFSESVTEVKLRNQLQQIGINNAQAIQQSEESKAAFAHFAESIERLIAAIRQQ